MSVESVRQAMDAHNAAEQALAREVTALLESNSMGENEKLRQALAALETRVASAEVEASGAQSELVRLRGALSAQMLSERSQLVSTAEKKLDIFFASHNLDELNLLRQLESDITFRLQALRARIKAVRQEEQQTLLNETAALEDRVHQYVQAAISAQPHAALTPQEQEQFSALRNEPLTEEQMQEIIRKNDRNSKIETFIGLNIINKLGILLIIIGVIAGAQYTLLRMPDYVKGAVIFLLGALMLLEGELLSRRHASVVSLGMTAGGVAVLYVAMSVSYFYYEILTAYSAIFVCILITIAAFLLSRRYGSQTIAGFALVGGYLPLLAVGGDVTMLFGAMGYFLVLNLLALLLSAGRRWLVPAFIGFGLSFCGTVYLSQRTVAALSGEPFGLGHAAFLGYVFATFLIYTAIPVVRTVRARETFGTPDLVLLALDAAGGALLLYKNLYALGLDHFAGLLTLLLAVVYVLLGRLMQARYARSERGCTLFYLTGLAFAALVVPFQFDFMWLSLGWLAEGTVLAVYGILNRDRLLRRFGLGVWALCALAFLYYDLRSFNGPLFPWQYLTITLSSLLLVATFTKVKTPRSTEFRTFHVGVAVNLWIYLLYLCSRGTTLLYGGIFTPDTFFGFIPLCLWFGATIASAMLYGKSKSEPILRSLSLVLYDIVAVSCLLANYFLPSIYAVGSGGIPTFGVLVLLLTNALAVFALRQMLHKLVWRGEMEQIWYPLVLCALSLTLLTEMLTVQLGLSFASLGFSLLYAIAAICCIVYGFVRRHTLMRRFGLGLTIFTVAKFFLFDLFSLTQGYRILSFFALGVSLIAISFLYQHFTRRLEAQQTEVHNAQKP